MTPDAKADLPTSQFGPILALLVSMGAFAAGASYAEQLFPIVGADGAATLRLAGGAIILAILMRPWRTLTGTADIWPLVVYGLAMGGMNLLFYMALSKIPLGIALALEFTGPLAVTVASSRAPADFLWMAVASTGILLLLPLGSHLQDLDPTGAILALGAGACWAMYIVAGRKAGRTHGAAATALGMGIGALVVLPVGIAHAGDALLRPKILLAGLAVAILSSALPYSLEMFALRRLRVQTYGTLTSCEPAIGALAGLVLLHESLTRTQVLAIALIVVAAIGTASAASRARREPARA